MVKFINKLGGFMLVDEKRVEEYKRLGHKLASETYTEEKPKKNPKKKKEE